MILTFSWKNSLFNRYNVQDICHIYMAHIMSVIVERRCRWLVTTYQTQINERCIEGNNVSVINLIPIFQTENKRDVKEAVENRLYEVFRKYISNDI